MKRILLTIISCCAITFSAIAQKPAPGTESVNEFLILLINQKVDISIQENSISPEGHIIIKTNGNEYFADNATITIEKNKCADLANVVSNLKTVMKISSKNNQKLQSLTFDASQKVPVTYEKKEVSDGTKPDLTDGRTFLLYDFKQITKYPELVDDDYGNGDFGYSFYKEKDFVTMTICGVDDEDKIKAVIGEFKSVMKKREIKQYLVVEIYESKTRISESRASLGKLIETMEIKDF